MTHPFIRCLCLAAFFLLLLSRGDAADEDSVFPAKSWPSWTPAEAGMHADKLTAIAELTGGNGCVVRQGRMVFTWGDPSKRGDVASACKTVLAHFLLKAVEQKRIPSVDARVSEFEPRLNDLNAALDFKDRGITWRHLVNQTSCYGSREAPGTAFDYNDYNFALLFDTLFLKVYGTSWEDVDEDVLRPQLTDLLQCEDQPTLMAFGVKNRPGRLAISVRDFARFGLLYLHDGNWNGRQLLKKELVKLAIGSPLPNSIPRTQGKSAEMIAGQRTGGGGGNQTDHKGSYSFMWWTNGVDRNGKRHWPDAPLDTFGAFGHGGKRAMVVLPGLDAIIVWNDTRIRRDEQENAVLKLLVEACEQSTGQSRERSDSGNKNLADLGTYAKWQSIDIELTGPALRSKGVPNPFAIDVAGVFVSPGGRRWRIPAFYDGDGRGGADGPVWRVRFSADEVGEWSFSSDSSEPMLDGYTAALTVKAASAEAPDFYRWGRLEAVSTAENGIRYLKFRDGPYWLKAGCDDPENFLGGSSHFDTLEERKSAIDYLAQRGINSLYVMTHNIGGDDNDVWPWLGSTAAEARQNGTGDVRFEISKLRQWREVFEHMQRRGVVAYLVLEDDSAWKGYDHVRYYREIVARFGDLPGVAFNIGEELNENYSLREGLDLAQRLAEIDPYDHPRGIHNVNRPRDEYIDSPQVDFTSIQTGTPNRRTGLKNALEHNQIAVDWLRRCAERDRRRLVVNFDEGRPELQRAAWWAAYLGGGVWEAHVPGPYDQPHAVWQRTWTELGGTRRFLESMPFWKMEPHNELIRSGEAVCLARPGEVVAAYLPVGGSITIELADSGSEYAVTWWNPDNGWDGEPIDGGKVSGGVQRLTAPAEGDWAVRLSAARPERR